MTIKKFTAESINALALAKPNSNVIRLTSWHYVAKCDILSETGPVRFYTLLLFSRSMLTTDHGNSK